MATTGTLLGCKMYMLFTLARADRQTDTLLVLVCYPNAFTLWIDVTRELDFCKR